MQVPRPTQDDRDYFAGLVIELAGVEVKPMFGNLGAFVNGNMFAGLFGSDVGVKLDEAGQEELRKAGGASFGPVERPMGGYVSLPSAWRETPDQARPWVARALEHVGALPPKVKKGKR